MVFLLFLYFINKYLVLFDIKSIFYLIYIYLVIFLILWMIFVINNKKDNLICMYNLVKYLVYFLIE